MSKKPSKFYTLTIKYERDAGMWVIANEKEVIARIYKKSDTEQWARRHMRGHGPSRLVIHNRNGEEQTIVVYKNGEIRKLTVRESSKFSEEHLSHFKE